MANKREQDATAEEQASRGIDVTATAKAAAIGGAVGAAAGAAIEAGREMMQQRGDGGEEEEGG